MSFAYNLVIIFFGGYPKAMAAYGLYDVYNVYNKLRRLFKDGEMWEFIHSAIS